MVREAAYTAAMRRSVWVAVGLLGSLTGCAGDEDVSPPDAGPADLGVAPTCPTHLRFTFLAGNRTDVGWTGAVHGSTYARDAFFRVRVTECDDECRQCAFEGPVRDDTVVTQRCVSDTAQVCSSDEACPNWECRELQPGVPGSPRVCANDATRSCTTPEDCGPSACRFFLGPSFPILAPRTCLGVYLDSVDGRPPVLGTIDLRTGEMQLERLRLISGATDSAVQGACPKCVGDPIPNDGVKGGTCMQNEVEPALPYDAAQSCDAMGIGQPSLFDGQYSLDCSTPLGVRITLGVEDGSTSGRRIRLTEAQPEVEGEPVWCGVCEGSLDVCYDDGDCRGVPCVAPTDLPVRNNACINECAWDPTRSRGSCLAPVEIPGVGTATITTSCFPSGTGAEVLAPGRATVLSDTSYSVQIGHVACSPPVRAVFPGPVGEASDVAIGLPGLQLNVLRFQVDQEFNP